MDAPSLSMLGGGDLGDDDCELMRILLLGGSPNSVDAAASLNQAQACAPPTTQPTKKNAAPATRGSKAKLTAVERRAKHREVVRRSYHRNKAVLSDLKGTVQQLEQTMHALQVERASDNNQLQTPLPTPNATVATITLQQQVDELAIESAALQTEAAQLQQSLATHQQFVEVVHTAATTSSGNDASSDDDDDDASSSNDDFEQQQPYGNTGSPWREPTQPETSDEDMASPAKRPPRSNKFYRSPMPAHVATPTPRAPISTQMWKDLAYTALTLTQARAFVGETYSSILTFALSGRTVSTGARVMGWEDRRLVDGSAIKFSLRKQFAGESAQALMTDTWLCFSDPECADKRFRGLMTLQILQHVNDDTIVALRDTLSPDGITAFRCVYLLFRVRTRSGFIICSRSIDHIVCDKSAAATTASSGRTVQWVQLNGWFVFDQLGYADDAAGAQFYETGAQVEYGGSMDYGDASYVPMLALETLSVVSRWEGFMLQPTFLLPPPSSSSL